MLKIYIVIYPQTCVSSFPRLISVARVNEWGTTDVTRVLKGPGAELYQNACGVVNEQKIFCSHQCSPECSMNKFRVYIYIIYRISSNKCWASNKHCTLRSASPLISAAPLNTALIRIVTIFY